MQYQNNINKKIVIDINHLSSKADIKFTERFAKEFAKGFAKEFTKDFDEEGFDEEDFDENIYI